MILNWENIKLDGLTNVAAEILKYSQSKKIAFYGELGAGKTTLIKELCNLAGFNSIVNSPTFTLLNEYHSKEATIFHFDFYRIKDLKEVYELGFEEYFYSDSFVFIEWPEKIEDLLPSFFSRLRIISINPESRDISWEV